MPIGGISCALFKLSYKYDCIWKNRNNAINDRKKALAKMILGLLAGGFFGISCILIILDTWITEIEIHRYFLFLFFIPAVLLGLCMPPLAGLGKAVEAGAPSVTGAIFRLKGQASEGDSLTLKTDGELHRKSEAEIEIVKQHLKKTSYSPTMPFSVFIISFLALYGILGGRQNAMIYTLSASSFAFVLTYSIQIVKGSSLIGRPNRKICSKCFKADYIGLKKCVCGGVYEPIDFYNYIEKTNKV